VTSPRVCRDCGAALSPDVRWCTLCFAPITEFAARPVSPIAFVDEAHHDVRTSRWHGGEMTFGPVGRVVATAVVLLMGPWASVSFFTLLYGPIWLGVAVICLRHIWQRRALDADAPLTSGERFRQRHPTLGARIDSRGLALILGAMFACAWLVGMIRSDTTGRFVLVVVAGAAGLAAFIAWIAAV
jgi:hypothetical protein